MDNDQDQIACLRKLVAVAFRVLFHHKRHERSQATGTKHQSEIPELLLRSDRLSHRALRTKLIPHNSNHKAALPNVTILVLQPKKERRDASSQLMQHHTNYFR